MKYMDKVRVLSNAYEKNNIKKNEIGTIINAEIKDNCFYVVFNTDNEYDWYKYCMINIEDLELVQDGGYTDEQILSELPNNNPAWWCKVEGGYIINLLGEKKNSIKYQYK